MKKYFTGIILTIISINMFAQNNGEFNIFNKNENIAFCVTNGATPNYIVNFDNNWEILLALRTPHSISALDSLGIKYSYSQLQLLMEWRLISKNKNLYKTSFTILDSLQTSKLRAYSDKLATKLTQQITPDISDLITYLSKMDRKKNAFSIFFSYIIDGKVWRVLENKSVIKERVLTLKKPFWDGEFWTLYPKRNFYCGTNTFGYKDGAIKMNWSKEAMKQLKLLLSYSNLFETFVKEALEKGQVTDSNIINKLSPFNLFDKSGKVTIPIIEENNHDYIYLLSEKIADTIVAFLLNDVDINLLKREFGFENDSQAIIILYHEILWDILNKVVDSKILTKPHLFTNSKTAPASDISDLLLLIKSN